MTQSVAEIRKNLSEALNRVKFTGEPVVVTSRGKATAAIVSMEDYHLLEELDLQKDLRVKVRKMIDAWPKTPGRRTAKRWRDTKTSTG